MYVCMAINTGRSLSLCGRAPAATLHPNRVPTDGGAASEGEEGQANPPQNWGVPDPTSGSTQEPKEEARGWGGRRGTVDGTGGRVGLLYLE